MTDATIHTPDVRCRLRGSGGGDRSRGNAHSPENDRDTGEVCPCWKSSR